MSNRLNGGYKGYDGRFLTSGTTIGHIQREQYFLERTQGRLSGMTHPVIPDGPYLKTLLIEDFETDTNFVNGSNYTWITQNGSETNYWVVGDDSSTLSGGTNSAYITDGSGTATNGDNVYTDAGASDSHIILQFETPTDYWNDGSGDPPLTLSFDWRCNGENSGPTRYDYGYVRFTSVGVTTSAGTNYAPPGQIGGDATDSLYDIIYQTPQNYSTWYTENIPSMVGWTGVTEARLIWSWHDDAAGGTAGNPPFAVDNILLTYTACTTNC